MSTKDNKQETTTPLLPLVLDGSKEHWYCASLIGWAVGVDLLKELERLKDHSGLEATVILKVLLPVDAEYPIAFYLPQVEEDKLVWVWVDPRYWKQD